jgi:hypothetical protein
MGRTNLKASLEKRLSHALGELQAAEKERDDLQFALKRLINLRSEIANLSLIVDSAETILRHDYPGWSRDQITPVRAGIWKSPFKPGDQGQVALATLREHGGWLRPREVAEIMLKKIDHDPGDADTLHRVGSSVGIYFKKYEDELVESRGSYAKEWRVIRQN